MMAWLGLRLKLARPQRVQLRQPKANRDVFEASDFAATARFFLPLMKRTLLPLLGLSLAIALPASAQTVVVAPVAATTTAAATGVAAEVNGDKIMLSDLNRMVEAIKKQEPAYSAGTPEANQALATVRQQLLDELITMRLLAQEAKRLKIVADPKQVDQAVENVKQGSGFKTDAEFRTALQKDGVTAEDLRRVLSDDIAIRQLSTQISSDITIGNDDVAAYYRAHPDQFTTPETVRARHILLAINPNAPASEKERVRKRAQDLIRQLNNKADFVALAKANSDDQSNKNQGGDLGEFAKGQMVKPFEEAAFNAPIGKVVGPVETDFGLHIIRVDAKTPAKTVSLSEVQKDPQIAPVLKAALLKQKVQARLDERIAALRKSANIKKNV